MLSLCAVSGPRKRKSTKYDDFEQDWGTENQPPKTLKKLEKESNSAAEAALKLEPKCDLHLGKKPLGSRNGDTAQEHGAMAAADSPVSSAEDTVLPPYTPPLLLPHSFFFQPPCRTRHEYGQEQRSW